MQLYILRHAVALANYAGPDAKRSLSKEGRRKLKQALPAICDLTEGIEMILSSPLVRAQQTAEMVAETLRVTVEVRCMPELEPIRPIVDVLSMLAKIKTCEKTLLVGHEPQLSLLVTTLLGATSGVVEFKKGALCCIECAGGVQSGAGKLLWHIAPRQLRALSKG